MHLLTKYTNSILRSVAVRLSCIQDVWCLKVKQEIRPVQVYNNKRDELSAVLVPTNIR